MAVKDKRRANVRHAYQKAEREPTQHVWTAKDLALRAYKIEFVPHDFKKDNAKPEEVVSAYKALSTNRDYYIMEATLDYLASERRGRLLEAAVNTALVTPHKYGDYFAPCNIDHGETKMIISACERNPALIDDFADGIARHIEAGGGNQVLFEIIMRLNHLTIMRSEQTENFMKKLSDRMENEPLLSGLKGSAHSFEDAVGAEMGWVDPPEMVPDKEREGLDLLLNDRLLNKDTMLVLKSYKRGMYIIQRGEDKETIGHLETHLRGETVGLAFSFDLFEPVEQNIGTTKDIFTFLARWGQSAGCRHLVTYGPVRSQEMHAIIALRRAGIFGDIEKTKSTEEFITNIDRNQHWIPLRDKMRVGPTENRFLRAEIPQTRIAEV